MKIKDIEALTNHQQKTIYRWMLRHPRLAVADEQSLLGHPFPRPVRKEGREVVWDETEVRAWWMANSCTVGRHPEGNPSIIMPWKSYRDAMLTPPKVLPKNEERGEEVVLDHMDKILRTERMGDQVRLWFRDADDAVLFKLKY